MCSGGTRIRIGTIANGETKGGVTVQGQSWMAIPVAQRTAGNTEASEIPRLERCGKQARPRRDAPVLPKGAIGFPAYAVSAYAALRFPTNRIEGQMAKYTLTYDDVLEFHGILVAFFAEQRDPIEPHGVRDENLLRSAIARADTSLGLVEKYPSTDAKAAALLHSLVKNHAFHNGNKRTALVSTVWFLDRNDRRLDVSDDDLFTLVTRTASGVLPDGGPVESSDQHVEAIRMWLAARCRVSTKKPSTIRLGQFLQLCELAGARVRKADGGYSILGRGGESIQIGGATRKLNGMAIKRYAQKLGLADAESGTVFDEFQAGLNPARRTIQNLLGVLRRLAHA
jgi:death-on-curing family protein